MKAVELLLGIGLLFGMTATSEAKKPNPAQENIVVIQHEECDVLSSPSHNPYIVFGADLPAIVTVSYTNTVPEELTIGLRDCCIRDDVVQVYVDDTHVGTVDSRNGAWGSHTWQYITVSPLEVGTHTIVFKNTISGVGPSGWYYSLSAVPLLELDYLKITPDPAKPLGVGETRQFTAKGYNNGPNDIPEDGGGDDIEVSLTSVAWSVKGDPIGSITSGGFFAATAIGDGEIKALGTVGTATQQEDDEVEQNVFGLEITAPDPEKFTFISTDPIGCTAKAEGAKDYEDEIEWKVEDGGNNSGTGEPATGEGKNFSFTPKPPEHPSYKKGGSYQPSKPLKYKITAKLTIDQSSGEDDITIEQDLRDTIRQEYVYHEISVPGRGAFSNSGKTKHFKFKELNTGNYSLAVITEKLWNGLEATRTNFSHPMIVNSAYRNPERNEKVGGVKNSRHQYGVAADIRVEDTDGDGDIDYDDWNRLAQAARDAGATFIEPFAQTGTWVHMDWR